MAEEAYLNALLKVKRLNFSFENDKPNINNDSQLTFQKAVKSYESIIDDIINSRHILKEKLKLEIDVLVKQKVPKKNIHFYLYIFGLVFT